MYYGVFGLEIGADDVDELYQVDPNGGPFRSYLGRTLVGHLLFYFFFVSFYGLL